MNEVMALVFDHIPWERIKLYLVTRQSWHGKLFLKKTKELFYAYASFIPTKNKAGEVCGYAAIFSEKAGNTLEINRAKEYQLNDLKNRFVSMASHEFRTPLSTILSSVYLLEKYTTTEQQTTRLKHAGKIKESVIHMNALLEDFLSIGNLEEGNLAISPSTFNLNELVQEIITELQPLQKEGQEILVSYNGGERITTDKKIARTIIANILSNALKFSPENRRVWISVTVSNRSLDFSIKDLGIGISREDLQHLFKTFHRGRNAQHIQGTGLGLHIVKRYVQLLKGNILVNSEVGVGTEVSVIIPLADPV